MKKTLSISLSEFFVYIKLGIWTSGNVIGLGLVEIMNIHPNSTTYKTYTLRKSPKQYLRDNLIIKRQLTIGLNLLDYYSIKIENKEAENIHILVISECRLKGTFEDKILLFKVINYFTINKFEENILQPNTDVLIANKRRFFKRKKRGVHSNFMPINAVARKY